MGTNLAAARLEMVLHTSCSAPDTDFTARLLDVYPPSEDYADGFALNLTDSIIRARYRDSAQSPTPVEPGQVYEMRFPLYPTSNVFRAGHRIRLDVSSSNFPRFDVNPDTCRPVGSGRRRAIAHQSIWHDPEQASHVILPLVPADEGG